MKQQQKRATFTFHHHHASAPMTATNRSRFFRFLAPKKRKSVFATVVSLLTLMIALALILCFLPIRLLEGGPRNSRLLLSSSSSRSSAALERRASTAGDGSIPTSQNRGRRRGGILAQSHLAEEEKGALEPSSKGGDGGGGGAALSNVHLRRQQDEGKEIQVTSSEADDTTRRDQPNSLIVNVIERIRRIVNNVDASSGNQVFGRAQEEKDEDGRLLLEPAALPLRAHVKQPMIRYKMARRHLHDVRT